MNHTDSAGYYLMHRGWLDTPALGGDREPFCRRAAWAWMIENARWQDGGVAIGGKTVHLQRGQMSHSLRYMARAWGWEEPKVRRFLNRLSQDNMIQQKTDAHQTVITICNYDIYQHHESVSDAAATQPRRSSDANKNTERESKILITGAQRVREEPDRLSAAAEVRSPASAAAPADEPAQGSLLPTADVIAIDQLTADFEAFYRAYPRKVAKPAAFKAYKRARQLVSHADLMAAIQRFDWNEDPKYRPHPATWLNQHRWADDLSPETATPSPRRDTQAPQRTAAPRHKPATPQEAADDPWGVQAWCAGHGFAPTETENDRRTGKWIYGGFIADFVMQKMALAARLPRTWRGDWSVVTKWIDDGLHPTKQIVPAIEWVATRVDYEPVGSLRFFDNAVRSRRAA